MKTKVLAFILLFTCLFISGCGDNEALKRERESLRTEIANLEKEQESLSSVVIKDKIDKGVEKYILTLKIKQTHYTLDLDEHLKDAANALTIQLPVTKEYYDSVEIGTKIKDSFRVGSMIFKSSFGSWNVVVKDKTIQ